MSFTDEEILAFQNEAEDLLENAEKSLLMLDKGGTLNDHYDSIFRALHSIKGAAGMMDMTALQSHMHQLENIFTEQKKNEFLEKGLIDLFLRGLDATRSLLKGQSIEFDYSISKQSDTAPVPDSPIVEPKKVDYLGKILVVDDEPEIVDLLVKLLQDENIEVEGLTQPQKVLETIDRFKPDVLFTDVSMPDMTGLDLLKLVKKSFVDLPVVFISGHVNKDVLLEAIQHGVYGVIEKPFDIGRVAECAINAIEKHKLYKMVGSSINLLIYQFSDLSEFLKSQGRHDIEKVISKEITQLIDQRRALRQRRKQGTA